MGNWLTGLIARLRGRRAGMPDREGGVRDVRDGGTYTRDEERDGLIRLIGPDADRDPPPENTRGEAWGWTKGPPYPRGWREDEDYGPTYRDRADPGPYDGAWDPPGGGA